MGYPKINNTLKDRHDKYGQHNAVAVAEILQNLSHNVVSAELTAGSTGATTKTYAFLAPTKGKITRARFVMTQVQTGTGNTPQATLHNDTDDDEIADSGAIALSGSIGDVHELTIDAAEAEFAAGDVLTFRIINPGGTITVALKGHLQIEWNSIP